MNNRAKRILTIAIVLAMCISVLAIQAFAEESTSVQINEIQSRIDAVLTQYGVTADMTDEEIVGAIAAMDGDTLLLTMEEIKAIEAAARTLTEEELSEVDGELYGRFCDVMERLTSPAIVTSYSLLNGQITVADSKNSSSESGGTVEINAKGSLFGKTTNNITIKNETANEITLTFDYSASAYSSFTIAGESASASGNYRVTLGSGSAVAIVLTSNSGLSNTTATLTLSNFQTLLSEGTVTVSANLGLKSGYIQADGVDITAYNYKGTDVTITDAGVTFKAVANTKGITYNGTTYSYTSKYAHFVAWVNPDTMEILSLSASYTVYPTAEGIKIKAIFAKDYSESAYFQVGNILYQGMGNALVAYESDVGDVITLRSTGSIKANESYTIPSGCTLLIPYDAAGTVFTTAPVNTTSTTKVSAYKTLYMRAGSSLTIDGTLSLAGRHYYARGNKSTGCVNVGATGMIRMYGNTNIIVNGSLYCYGYIYGYAQGNGQVTVNNGAQVYEYFQLEDFRGGTQTFSDMKHEVFPFSQYFVQNVQVPMTLHYGAKEYAYTTLYLSSSAVSKAIQFIGSSDCFVTMSEGASVTKTYDINTDRVTISLNGSCSVSNFAMSMYFYSFDTADYVMPIPSYMTLKIESGTATVNQDIALIPGSRLEINEGATVKLGNGTRIYVYDQDVWGTYNWDKAADTSNSKFQIVRYAVSRAYTRTEADLIDAEILVNGTLDASAGSLYTTEGCANINSTGNGQVKLTAGKETVTYQLIQAHTVTTTNAETGESVSTDYDNEYVEIPITTAQLKNSNGTYLQSGTGTYTYINGFWHTGTACSGGTATCQAKATCSICKQLYGNLGSHTEVIDTAVAPTFTTVGKTEGKHCSLCNTVTVGRTDVVAATINGTNYAILSEAITAATASDTIVLQANISGEVPIGKLVTINKNGYTVTLTEADGFVITETSEANTVTSLIKIMATNIVVSNGLDMYFYVNAACIPDNSGYTAVVTKHFADGRTDVTESFTVDKWKTNGSYVGFGFSDISAKEMTDDIEVTIYDSNGAAVSKTYTQSVQDYVILTLKQDSTNDALRTALIDMLNYGAAAQQFFNYNTGVLANVDPEGESVISANSKFATSNVGDCNNTLTDPPAEFAGVTVSAKNTLMFTFYFYIDDPTGMVATITYTDHNNTPQTETVRAEDFYMRSEGLYGVDVERLSIVDGRCMMNCTITDGAGNAVVTVSDSIEGYVARKSDGNNDIFEQMMKFVDSAVNYFDSLKGE